VACTAPRYTSKTTRATGGIGDVGGQPLTYCARRIGAAVGREGSGVPAFTRSVSVLLRGDGAEQAARANTALTLKRRMGHKATTWSGAAERSHSPASVRPRRRRVLALARSARGGKYDDFLKHRARQVQWVVMQPVTAPEGTATAR